MSASSTPRRSRSARRSRSSSPTPTGRSTTRSSTSTRRSIPRPGRQVPHHVPNPDRRPKAGMFVRVLLDIPPVPGQTVIPRGSMVSVDRLDYVFIQQPGTDGPRSSGGRSSWRRRATTVVIVAAPSPEDPGLRPGRGSRDRRQPDPRADVRGPPDGRGRHALCCERCDCPTRRVIPHVPVAPEEKPGMA